MVPKDEELPRLDEEDEGTEGGEDEGQVTYPSTRPTSPSNLHNSSELARAQKGRRPSRIDHPWHSSTAVPEQPLTMHSKSVRRRQPSMASLPPQFDRMSMLSRRSSVTFHPGQPDLSSGSKLNRKLSRNSLHTDLRNRQKTGALRRANVDGPQDFTSIVAEGPGLSKTLLDRPDDSPSLRDPTIVHAENTRVAVERDRILGARLSDVVIFSIPLVLNIVVLTLILLFQPLRPGAARVQRH
jgi:hypothetical protein